ncbi:MAG: HD domain-containing phosphohydrolase [Ruminiclostridium sp.]
MGKAAGKNYRILIVDDSEINRVLLSEILSSEYEIIEADSGDAALQILNKSASEIDLVLLDVVMPGTDGYDVLECMNRYGIIEEVPVIMISAESSTDFITKAYDMGAADYVGRPFEAAVVQRRVKNAITLYAKQRRLVDIVASQIYEKEKNNKLMVAILSHIVEFRNGESGAHVVHINIITELLLHQLVKKSKRYDISMADIRLISTASSLHDIGKIAIPDNILNKPGRFTPSEYEIMKTHSEIGAAMLKNLSDFQSEPLLKASYEICRWHHERYDGKGYPDGLKGDEIPISAQVVSIADVYDALTSERCYKKAYTHEKAIEMICGGECGVFNPLLIECLKDISDKLKEDLQNNNISTVHDRREMQSLTDEIINNSDLAASGQMLQQIEFERSKADFYETELSDIFFSFQKTPPVLTLSGNAARQLGLNRIITEPLENEEVRRIASSSLAELAEKLAAATVDNPMVDMTGSIVTKSREKSCEYHCRTLWTDSESPVCIGVAGKIVYR